MSIETFFFILGLIFVIALSGTVVGLLWAWPRGGRGWSWKRARLLIASVGLLVAFVAFYIYLGSTWDYGE